MRLTSTSCAGTTSWNAQAGVPVAEIPLIDVFVTKHSLEPGRTKLTLAKPDNGPRPSSSSGSSTCSRRFIHITSRSSITTATMTDWKPRSSGSRKHNHSGGGSGISSSRMAFKR